MPKKQNQFWNQNLFIGTVLARPSKKIKSPYLADVQVDGEIEDNVLCHSPSLGCCGHIIPGARVLLSKIISQTAKSKYSVDFIYDRGWLVGANPNFGNKFGLICLEKHLIKDLPKFEKVCKEYTYKDSRFDFYCETQDQQKFYIEVKSVPLADFVDVTKKERDSHDTTGFKEDEKIAIFPDGYRKNNKEPVSARAIKHLRHLQELTLSGCQGVMIYFVQRSDCKYFKPSVVDPQYLEAFYMAQDSGVLMLAYSVDWIVDDDLLAKSFLGKKLKVLQYLIVYEFH